MTPRLLQITVAAMAVGLLSTLCPAGQAGDQPHRPSYATTPNVANHTRLVIPAERHPQVAVSRSLAAQPVHPWMAEVQVGGSMTTYVDPVRDLDGEGRLHANHSLVQAQRLYRSLHGVTTRQLNEARNAALAAETRGAGCNRAYYIPPRNAGASEPQTAARPVMIFRRQAPDATTPPHRVQPQQAEPLNRQLLVDSRPERID